MDAPWNRHLAPGLLGVLLLLFAAPVPALADDRQAVLDTVERAYIEGIHKNQDPEAIRAGFHEDFVMFIRTDEGVRQMTRDEWIAAIERGKAEHPDRPRPEIAHRFPRIDLTDTAAVVKVEVDRDGEHTFTDYLSLYKLSDGWKIVGKIFHSHR